MQLSKDGAVTTMPVTMGGVVGTSTGTVGQLDLVEGEQASTSTGVIVGPDAAAVTADLPLAHLGSVRVGQDVNVTPAGTITPVAGPVQSIGVLPSSTTTSTPTYPLRITVSDAPVSLAAGSTATATLTLATASDVLTLPVSAVAGVSAGAGSVRVLSGGVVRTTPVTIGAVGEGRAEVAQGSPRASGGARRPRDRAAQRHQQPPVDHQWGTSLTGQGGPGGGMGGPTGG